MIVSLCLVLTFGMYGISHSGESNMNPEDPVIAMAFPKLEAKTLSGEKIVYPDSVKGKVTLLVLAFERQTQDKVDSWLGPFMGQFAEEDRARFYEIPMLAGKWKLLSGIIDGGMRRGVPGDRHDHVSTFYGDVDRYCEQLQIGDKSDGYVFLLDRDGVIRWRSNGWATEEKLQALFEKTRTLMKMR